MIKEIKKSDLVDWNYGDVGIKTYSYGDLLAIKDMADINGTEIVAKTGYKDSDVGMMILTAGIHYIRNVDGTGYEIAPGTTNDIKKRLCYMFDASAVFTLLKHINELNSPLTEQEKK